MSVFETLNGVNVNEHAEKKSGLTYLSWAWAWAEVKKAFPDAQYTIYENNDGWNYHTDGKTCWVKTGITINGLEHIEYLPIMDFRNKSIPLEQVTSFDVNKAIQRSLTKASARHGLGLYIYAGEDLPEGEEEDPPADEVKPKKKSEPPKEIPWSPRTEASKWAVSHGMTNQDFADARTALIMAGRVIDIPVKDLTREQFKTLIDSVEAYRKGA